MSPNIAAFAAFAGVQDSRVRGVRSIFNELKIICRPKPIIFDGTDAILASHDIDFWQDRRFTRAEIGPDQAAQLSRLVGLMADFVLERAVGRLRGPGEAISTYVELPAVVATLDSVRPNSAQFKRCSAMRAMQSEQGELTMTIAEENEVFTQDPHRSRSFFERTKLLAKLGDGAKPDLELKLFVAVPQCYDSVPSIGNGDWMPVLAQPLAAGSIRPDPSE